MQQKNDFKNRNEFLYSPALQQEDQEYSQQVKAPVLGDLGPENQ